MTAGRQTGILGLSIFPGRVFPRTPTFFLVKRFKLHSPRKYIILLESVQHTIYDADL